MNKKLYTILAVDQKNGLGKNGDLAWKLPADMKYFRNITTKTKDKNKKNAVIMGRKTWESIPKKFRPLPGRVNCILSRNFQLKGKNTINDSETSSEGQTTISKDKNTYWFNSLKKCIKKLESDKTLENIFIIGGARLYNDSLKNPNLDKIYITRISGDFNCDIFFDGIPDNFELENKSEIKKEKDIKYFFEVWKRK